ncbi:hypothetical protein ACUNWD_14265 [Sunxiuqinia sp. A32]|uniref:hypothetical protein n=1 Tax=Sunxiuqinia sp. A32 TaxID=3461496 RepID=UPI0040452535
MRNLLIVGLSLLVLNSWANLPDPVKEFYKNAPQVNGRALDASYQQQAQIAMNYYPELSGKKIEFVRKDLKTTMASLPKLDFLFRKKENRRYQIFIDTKVKASKGLLLSEVPFNAQVGIIGHELGHVVDYENKSAVGILLTGVGYLFHPFRKKLERKVDEITVAHGLGYQVHEFSKYVLNDPHVSAKYKKYKRKIYYKPKQLSVLMQGYEIY